MESIKRLIKEIRSNVIQLEGKRTASIDKYISMRKTALKDLEKFKSQLEQKYEELEYMNNEIFDLIEQDLTIEYLKVKIKKKMKSISKKDNEVKITTEKVEKYESIINVLRNGSSYGSGVYVYGDRSKYEEQIKDTLLDLGEYTERNGYNDLTDGYKNTLWNLLGYVLNDFEIVDGYKKTV